MSDTQEKQTSSESQPALMRLLTILIIAFGFAIYSYGWTVTDVDLEVPQEPRRQENLTLALRDLLSPRLFQQEREVVRISAPFLMDCDSGEVPEQDIESQGSTITILDPVCGDPGDIISVQVSNSTGGADARIRWLPPAGEGEQPNERPREVLETGREDFVLAANGSFSGTIEVPRIRGGDGQIHEINVLVAVPSGPVQFSDISKIVIEKMAETIFMALIATTVAIPIAVLISFFAARNLMKPVRLSAGTIFLYFLSFVLGTYLGSVIAGGVFGTDTEPGNDTILMVLNLARYVIPVILFLRWILRRSEQQTNKHDAKRGSQQLSAQLLNIVTGVVVFAAFLGLFTGLAALANTFLAGLGTNIQTENPANIIQQLVHITGVLISAIGNLFGIISTLLGLFKEGIAAILTGFLIANISSILLGSPIRRISGVEGKILGAILGAASGGILMMIMALLGLWAALLGLLPAIIGAILGGQSLQLILSVIRAPQQPFTPRANSQKFLDLLIFWLGAFGAFILVFQRLNIGRALVDGTLPPQNDAILLGVTLPMTQYVFEAFTIGAVLGGISGALTGVQKAFPLGSVLYNFSRTALNTVRSIEPLIMGLVFVIWVGIGPFAGVLALTLHSIAALGKLYSEQIENIDPGPIEALESTGANRLQTIVYAVIPQIVPPYIAFTMYRWDINVRMSTIIGFVGGGGIGLLLQQQINLLRYRDAGVAVLAIAIVVSILDYLSAIIRERLT